VVREATNPLLSVTASFFIRVIFVEGPYVWTTPTRINTKANNCI